MRSAEHRPPQSSELPRTDPSPLPTLRTRKRTLTEDGTADDSGWPSNATLPQRSPLTSMGQVGALVASTPGGSSQSGRAGLLRARCHVGATGFAGAPVRVTREPRANRPQSAVVASPGTTTHGGPPTGATVPAPEILTQTRWTA